MKLVQTLVTAAVACGALVTITGCGRLTSAESNAAASAANEASVVRVKAGRPERKTLTLLTSQPGRVEAFQESPLYPKVTGYVEQVHVDIGDAVTKGQLLIQLWIPELQAEQEQKQALVAQAAAEVQQAEAGVQVAEATIQSAQARISQAEAGVGRAEGAYQRWSSESERIRELAANSSVTTKLADETLSQFRAAEASRSESIARVETATAERNEAQANAAKSRADLVAANAQLRVAQASLKQTTTMLGYAEVKAPFDGVITRRSVDTGHYVYPASGGSTQPMLVIASIDRVRIFVDVPELEASLVDVGDPAVVRLPSHLGGELAATVTRSSWSLSQANHSIRTEIDIPNEQGLLRPGMYTSVSIRLDERSDVLALPITAILRDGQATYCYCVEADQLVRKAIALGLRSGSEVEVVSGLSGSESVVLAQAESLQPGQRVEVMQPAK